MSPEGNDTIQELNSSVEERGTLHEGNEINSEIRAAYAGAEEGMTPIPDTVEVEDLNTLAQLVSMDSKALEQYRVDNPGE